MTDAWLADGRGEVVRVTGPDAASFLQSLVSQDVDAVPVGAGAASLLLQPQGKLVAPFRMLRVADDDLWLVTDAGAGEPLAGTLTRYRIRVRAEVTAEPDWSVLAVRGRGADALAAALGIAVPEARHAHVEVGDGVRLVTAAWGIESGFDLVGPSAAVDALAARLETEGAVPLAADVAEARRIALGVARMGADLDDGVIPQEAELELDGVSFTKGCFLGQELVCRIDTRGHVNRYLRRLELAGPAAPGDVIALDGSPVGAVTSAADGVALGWVRREVPLMSTVTVGTDTPARVLAR